MAEDDLAAADAALATGRWTEARDTYTSILREGDSAEARWGLASALWWLGDNRGSVAECTRAYAGFRRLGNQARAVQCAVWLAIAYKANFANYVAANGWLRRADRLLESRDADMLHAWTWVARAYRMTDLATAEALTTRALEIGRRDGDIDLELTSLAQLGLIRVGQGAVAAGFDLIDEAVVAALAGEQSTLDTVVYACCDMLNACELAHDVERAAQWCQAADDFVDSYGCPFLYAECRIYYGSVLAATGRWADAERELASGVAITESTCPALHGRALSRLATLRLRQGRFEDAAALLADCRHDVDGDADATLASAALALARGDARRASALLEQRIAGIEQHRSHLVLALDLLVDTHIAAGDVAAAGTTALRLGEAVTGSASATLQAIAADAAGRAALAGGDERTAAAHLSAALSAWIELDHPYEAARTRHSLAVAHSASHPHEAIDLGRRALQTFDELGAVADADRCAALLRSLGVAGRSGPRRDDQLTKREQEVLRLVAAGLSNPEIATRLHVSRKTAAHHVSNVLAKLGVRNRAEAAAHAARMGQLTDAPATR